MSLHAPPLTNWLARAPKPVFIAHATFAAFGTYFCMYAFRKPFAAAQFDGQHFLGGDIALKTAFVVSQILGYTASKYIGIKVYPEVRPGRRAVMLVPLIPTRRGLASSCLQPCREISRSWRYFATACRLE